MFLERVSARELRDLADLFETLSAQLDRGVGDAHVWNLAVARLGLVFQTGCDIRDAVGNGRAGRDWTTLPTPPDETEER